MADFLNIFGSILLIAAGIGVLIAFFMEKPAPVIATKKSPNKLPTISNKIDYKIWLRVGIFAIALRWWIYLFSFSLLDTNQSFWQIISNVFSVSGDAPHYLHLAEHGYVSTGDKANLIVFYPLYPLLVKLFNIFCNDYFISRHAAAHTAHFFRQKFNHL